MEIANITIELTRKVIDSNKLCKDSTNSQSNDTCKTYKTNCKSLQRTLVNCSCGKGKTGHKRWYMRQLPIANTIAGIYSKMILLETNKTKLISKSCCQFLSIMNTTLVK